MSNVSLVAGSNYFINQINPLPDQESISKKDNNKNNNLPKPKYTVDVGPFFYRSYGGSGSFGLNLLKPGGFLIEGGRKENVHLKADKNYLKKVNDNINSKMQGYTCAPYADYPNPPYDITNYLKTSDDPAIDLGVINGSTDRNDFIQYTVLNFFNMNVRNWVKNPVTFVNDPLTTVEHEPVHDYYSGWGGSEGYHYQLQQSYTLENTQQKYLYLNLLGFDWKIVDWSEKNEIGSSLNLFFNSAFTHESYKQKFNLRIEERYHYYGGEGNFSNLVFADTLNFGYAKDTYSFTVGIALDHNNIFESDRDDLIVLPYGVRYELGLKYEHSKYYNLENVAVDKKTINNYMIYFGVSFLRVDLNLFNFN